MQESELWEMVIPDLENITDDVLKDSIHYHKTSFSINHSPHAVVKLYATSDEAYKLLEQIKDRMDAMLLVLGSQYKYIASLRRIGVCDYYTNMDQ